MAEGQANKRKWPRTWQKNRNRNAWLANDWLRYHIAHNAPLCELATWRTRLARIVNKWQQSAIGARCCGLRGWGEAERVQSTRWLDDRWKLCAANECGCPFPHVVVACLKLLLLLLLLPQTDNKSFCFWRCASQLVVAVAVSVVDVCWLAAWLTAGQHTHTYTPIHMHAHTHLQSAICALKFHTVQCCCCWLNAFGFWVFSSACNIFVAPAVHLGYCCCCCRLPHAAGNKMALCPAPVICPRAQLTLGSSGSPGRLSAASFLLLFFS